ncbi:MAG: HPr(Ser) kinase/phosphatase [Kiritimatiellae bacterium]|jgi:HPr kinase/phosphorylase|nr:HPr(Ser) kinase/phosphatase [Kiritimatiellia bacterium]MDD2347570.1 HPr(Ser) kinase/phosphatase [Kiritimatiellia bacterium]MDD3583305.1 HPr(Ser) kinase/phosphatase [Kiritimatiellia bacterium]HHU14928.1 HPr(Ser) kinase/phosphatase [Lentisphaerota bacterium]HON47626.1 HPr(Ser) kinase/phosphatase [Kiritimatiellia bacterium]
MAGPKQSQARPSRVTVGQFFEAGRERLGLELVTGRIGLRRVIVEPVAHRPGLALSGFYRHFAHKRIQVIGMAEFEYLSSMPEAQRVQRLEELFAKKIPCIVFTRGKRIFPEVERLAKRNNVCVLRTNMVTRHFVHSVSFVLEELYAPRCKVHGTMLEVAGVGVFIEGAAGLGKSETALGLIKRGHALVADDLTQFRRDSNNTLLGSALPVTQYFMEIRGIGIIHVPSIFGVAAVRGEKQVDLVVTLKRQGEADAELDRTGMDDLRREFLGVEVPQLVIPVALGRDLVNLVETAAQEHKVRSSGFVAVSELESRIKRHHST